MKYFKVTSPYYGLIAAETEEKAIKIYVEEIANNDDGEVDENIEEISRDIALMLFARNTNADGTYENEPSDNMLKEFEKGGVLAVDGSLIW